MKLSVFVGTSLDGFIARLNGDFDFLPVGGGEAHGYAEFMASVDVLIIGRNTFDQISRFDAWPYAGKRVVVLTHRPIEPIALQGASFDVMSGPPTEIIAALEAGGASHGYIDGGETIQEFLRAGLIQSLTITRVPVLIGEGIPLFGVLPRDTRLRHVATTPYASGLVKSEYHVLD